jgi:hypothetical protein
MDEGLWDKMHKKASIVCWLECFIDAFAQQHIVGSLAKPI